MSFGSLGSFGGSSGSLGSLSSSLGSMDLGSLNFSGLNLSGLSSSLAGSYNVGNISIPSSISDPVSTVTSTLSQFGLEEVKDVVQSTLDSVTSATSELPSQIGSLGQKAKELIESPINAITDKLGKTGLYILAGAGILIGGGVIYYLSKNYKMKIHHSIPYPILEKIPEKVKIKGGRAKYKSKYGTVQSSYKDLEVGK